jgi:hypothetical protein
MEGHAYLAIGKDGAMLRRVQVGYIDALAPHPLQRSVSVHLRRGIFFFYQHYS